LEKLTLLGNYTNEKATFEKEPFKDNDIPAVPRHKANLGLRIFDVLPGLVFSADYNYVGSSYLISDQANQFEKLDNYYTLDARLTYNWKWLSAFVGVNNLTDQEYVPYGVVGGSPPAAVFYPAPERNWVAGLNISFKAL
jgi:iron complex outermembrane receptor protein